MLDAALEELKERGYAASSLQSIARRAGLTKGAAYWSFRDKQDLFMTLVHERIDEPARALIGITESAPRETETAPLVSSGFAALVRERPEVLLLVLEQWSLALRDREVRAAYNRRQDSLRTAIAEALESRHATLGVPLTYPAERLGTAMLALASGLAVEALVEPKAVPDELLGDVLSLIYDGLAFRAGKRARA